MTGPVTADPDSTGTDDAPFLGVFFLEVETGSSFTGLTSYNGIQNIKQTLARIQKLATVPNNLLYM